MRAFVPLLICGLLVGVPAAAVDLTLPAGASLTREVIREADTVILPQGPHSGQEVPSLRLEGRIVSRAWRMPVQGITTLQILMPLRDQLETSGWEVMFDCEAVACGGFDFRFALPTLPAPDMFVDLFEYRYLLVRRGGVAARDYVALIVSQSGQTGYVQAVHVSPLAGGGDVVPTPTDGLEATPQPPSDLVRILETQGHAVLEGLDFGSGDNALGPGPHASLAALADMLRAAPQMRVALVGHTDSTGGLEGNTALSKARAEAVRIRLIEKHGVAPAQLEAHGIGYLAPIAPNTNPEVRNRNRRVEAVLLDTAAQ